MASAADRPVRVALLHTSPVHVATFDALAAEAGSGATLRHVVREDLLARARAEGPDAVRDEVAALLGSVDADVVLCTCSTLGALAEGVGAAGGRRVLRVDRPMAAAAVAGAGPGRITVLAALASTLDPTRELLAEEATRAGVTPDLDLRLIADAWARFEVGDLAGYHRVVAAAIEDAVADGAAVVVLAQASMAPAAELVRSTDPVRAGAPVLSSPRLGLAAAFDRCGDPGPLR